jgi:hypothetical protein
MEESVLAENSTEMAKLPENWSVCVGTVFEDAINQLQILGCILPVQKNKTSVAYQNIADEIIESLAEKRDLEAEIDGFDDTQRMIKQLTQEIVSQKSGVSARGLDGQDNLMKINRDRQFAFEALKPCLDEITADGSFNTLQKSVEEESVRKCRFRVAQQKETNAKRELKDLNRRLAATKKGTETEVHELTEMIAHIKDQIQELKSQTAIEGRYVKKSAETSIEMNASLRAKEDGELQEILDTLKRDIESENRAHTDVKNFLLKKRRQLEDKIEFWMEKYENDTESRTNELTNLKSDKDKDLRTLQELARTFDDYERVVKEDRAEKKRIKDKKERDELERVTSVKIQAWWRGTMVRKGLGEFKKDKGKKGKKGKKGGKKGKGKKK